MARPIKKGLDYFPFDVLDSTPLLLMEAEYGLEGYAVILKIYQIIYGEEGYFCRWTEDEQRLFARKHYMDFEVVGSIVAAAVGRGIFDKRCFTEFGILTSADIQARYISAKRNGKDKIVADYLLVEINSDEGVFAEKVCNNSDETVVIAAETTSGGGVFAAESTQRKENKTKEKEIKENKSTSDQTACEGGAEACVCFEKPSLEAVKQFFAQAKLQTDPTEFFNHCEATGWIVANQPVRNWKALARRWKNLSPPKVNKRWYVNDYEQREYSNEELEGIFERKKTPPI